MQLEKYNSLDSRDFKKLKEVFNTKILSDFLAKGNKKFYGGKYVQKFEKEVQSYFKVKYAITVNSWTSGLICIMGALDIEPGDEVILPSWTMSACMTAILNWGAIPIFADVDIDSYCIDPNSVRKLINKKTKAIMAVDIFGGKADYKVLKKIADRKKIHLICDSAQSIGSKYYGKLAGTMYEATGYSLNCHKHIQTGEGGLILTNSKYVAEKCFRIRNHGENQTSKSKKQLINNLGYNFRLTELQSALGISQLEKLKEKVKSRQKIARIFDKELNKFNWLKLSVPSRLVENSYYVYPIRLLVNNKIKLKSITSLICKRFKESGFDAASLGYTTLHKLDVSKKKILYGSKGFPWSLNKKIPKTNFTNIEKLNKSVILIQMCKYELKKKKEIDYVKKIIRKIFSDVQNLL